MLLPVVTAGRGGAESLRRRAKKQTCVSRQGCLNLEPQSHAVTQSIATCSAFPHLCQLTMTAVPIGLISRHDTFIEAGGVGATKSGILDSLNTCTPKRSSVLLLVYFLLFSC